MEIAYRAFKERKAHRWKAFGTLVTLLIIEIVVVAYVTYNAGWFYNYGFMIVMFSLLVGVLYLASRSWAHEWYETEIFVNMYEASKLLELCSKENEDPLFYSRKATKKVRYAIGRLRIWCNRTEASRSKLVKKEYAEPLRNLKENLETRILPRIAQHKDIESMIRVLRGLGKLFSETEKPVSLDDIISKNKDLERYDSIELEESPTRHFLATIMFSRPVKFLSSIFLGYLSITIVIWTLCHFLTVDFVEFMRSNLLGVVSGGAVLTGIIASFFIFKK